MTLLIGSLTIGLILSLLAMGVYISFRVFDMADLTADGSSLRGRVCAVLLATASIPWGARRWVWRPAWRRGLLRVSSIQN